MDTSTAAGKAFFDMLGVFAEFETNRCHERQAEGIAEAKERGAYQDATSPSSVGAVMNRASARVGSTLST